MCGVLVYQFRWCLVWGVRGVVRKIQEEGLLPSFIDKSYGLVGQRICQASSEGCRACVLEQRGQVRVLGCAGVDLPVVVTTRQHAIEVVESALKGVEFLRRAQMPLADDAVVVAGVGKVFREERLRHGQSQRLVIGIIGQVGFHAETAQGSVR